MPAARKLEPILVKRYACSRLHDTTNGHYVSVEQLRGWTVDHVAFAVIDSQTGADITRVMLPVGLKVC